MIVGRILRPHGIRGEMRMEILTGYPERLPGHRVFYLGPQAKPYPVESVRFHQGAAIIKLTGCDDRNAAEALCGLMVHIPLQKAVPLEEGEYYYFQVVGVEVYTDQGEHLGRVVDILETRANNVYVVRGPRGEILIPAVEEIVRELDLTARRMVILPLPGLLP